MNAAIFSLLGLILFELITLKKAFQANKTIALLKQVLKAELAPMSHYHPPIKVSKELQAITKKATAKKPDKRYTCVKEFADDIRRHLRGEAILAQPDTWVQSGFRWMIRNKELTAITLLCLLLVSASFSIYNIYQRTQSLIAAQVHEKQLNIFLQDVVEQSQKVNTHFLQIETLLESLGNAGSVLLMKSNTPLNHPLYLLKDQKPEEVKFSPLYKNKRTTEHGISFIPHRASTFKAKQDLSKLYPLHKLFKALFLKSAHLPLNTSYSPSDFWDLIGVKGTSIVYSYIALESGAYLEYPGGLDFPIDYDPRKRPWYKEAKMRGKTSWITPYVDGSGLGLMISCQMPLFDQRSEFQGVAGMDMTFNYVKEHLLSLKKHPKFKAEYLLDPKGKIMVNSKARQEYQVKNAIRKAKSFHNAKVMQMIQDKKSGYILDKESLIAFYRIESLGWYYVIEGKESELLGQIRQ